MCVAVSHVRGIQNPPGRTLPRLSQLTVDVCFAVTPQENQDPRVSQDRWAAAKEASVAQRDLQRWEQLAALIGEKAQLDSASVRVQASTAMVLRGSRQVRIRSGATGPDAPLSSTALHLPNTIWLTRERHHVSVLE